MTIALLVVMTIGAWAQGAGLSQGQAVKQATATPTRASKTCPHCGITKGNITYPWQHESWCPYYQAKNTGTTTSGGSRSSSNAGIVASGIASGVGSALSGALSNWLNSEPKKDYSATQAHAHKPHNVPNKIKAIAAKVNNVASIAPITAVGTSNLCSLTVPSAL